MRCSNLRTELALFLLLGFFPVGGQAQVNSGRTREPNHAPPTIVEYQPRSTLVVPEHPVPRAKFPVVDFHGHPPTLDDPEVIQSVVEAMDALNLQVIVQTRGSQGERLTRQIEAVRAAGYEDRFAFFTTVDLREVGPGSGARIAAQLEADVAAGAVGVGEIGKGFGLQYRKTDGSRLELDDPELDVVWEAAARLGVPVFIHTGDPAEFFEAHDFRNERWLEMSIYPDRQLNDRSRFPSFDELMAERDRLIARHPNTIWVLAHMSWYTQDLARLGELFDRFPNVYGELGAVLYDLGRQPRFAGRFFEKYRDRILFGKDAFQPDEYPYYWRVFETEDEYFDYYRDYHAFWKLYGMGLSDDVLKSIYYGNALRLIPGMPVSGFPAEPGGSGGGPVSGREAQEVPEGTVIVANMDDDTVWLVDLSSGERRALVQARVAPHEVAVTADGRMAAVTNYGDRERGPGNLIQFVDVASGEVIREITVDGYERLHGAAFLPGDSLLILTSERTGELLVVGGGDGGVRRVLSTGGQAPHMLAPGGDWIYAANILSGTVSRIDPRGREENRVWEAGTRTEGVAATPDGAEGWTASMDQGFVVGVDGETGEIVGRIEGLQVPYRLAVTPDGSTVVATDPEAGTLVLIDRAGGRLAATIDVNGAAREAGFQMAASPQGFVLSPDGAWAFVSTKEIDRVAVIHLETRRVVRFLQAGDGPDGIGYSPVTGPLR